MTDTTTKFSLGIEEEPLLCESCCGRGLVCSHCSEPYGKCMCVDHLDSGEILLSYDPVKCLTCDGEGRV